MSLDTVCCSVLQCVAVCCSVRLESLVSASDALVSTSEAEMMRYVSRYSVLQCVTVCCSVLQCTPRVSASDAETSASVRAETTCSYLIISPSNVQGYIEPWHAICISRYSVLQCVAVCCSVLQCTTRLVQSRVAKTRRMP